MGRSNKKKNKQKQKRKKNAGAGNNNDAAGQSTAGAGSGAEGGEHRYARYKEATRSFRDDLSKLLPGSIPLASVSDLGNAVEYLLGEWEKLQGAASSDEISPPPVGVGLLSCLNVSIKLREEITEVAGGDADGGHAYMNSMLRYCQSVLRKCRRMFVASTPASRNESSNTSADESRDGLSGRFGALSMHEEDESEEEENGEAPIQRPPDPKREYSIEKDLIDGDDRIHTSWFIVQLNVLMDFIEHHFHVLRGRIEGAKSRSDVSEANTNHTILVCVMAASISTNLALEEIKCLEEAFVAEHPQFKTFYHVLAQVVFSDFRRQLENVVDPKVLAKNPHIALDFVAEEVARAFEGPIHPRFYDYHTRTKLFARRANVSKEKEGIVVFTSEVVLSLTFLHVCPEFVKEGPGTKVVISECREICDNIARQTGIQDAFVLWEALGIGTKLTRKLTNAKIRRVLRIQSMLQGLRGVMTFTNTGPELLDDSFLNPKPNSSTWDESTNKADTIDDLRMENFFLRKFFEPMFNKARCHDLQHLPVFDDCFQHMLPRFFPLLQNLLDYIRMRGRDSPVSYSFTLSVYAMLTGVLQLQGHLEMIATLSRNATAIYYDQVQWVRDQKNRPEVDQLLKVIMMGRNASVPTHYPGLVEDQKLFCFWNPLAAGCYLTQTALLNNTWYADLMGLHASLVTFLHLFNALKTSHLLQDGDIPLLDAIDESLDTCSSIWGEGKPVQDFCQSYFVASGSPLSAAKKMAEFSAEVRSEEKENEREETQILVARMELLVTMRGALTRGSRQERRILLPTDVSSMYRHLVKRDFSGLEQDSSQGNIISSLVSMGSTVNLIQYQDRHMALENKLRDEADKLSMMNLPKLSWLLKEATSQLATHMGWDSVINECCCTGVMSQSKSSKEEIKCFLVGIAIGDRVLGDLDGQRELGQYTDGKTCADFLKGYFDSIRKEEIWFLSVT